jgi:hypothetical protein
MMMAKHVLTLRAYARKKELGGGFRARVIDHENRDAVIESDVLPTYESARNWAMQRGHQIMGARPYRRCSINAGTAGSAYRANIWA